SDSRAAARRRARGPSACTSARLRPLGPKTAPAPQASERTPDPAWFARLSPDGVYRFASKLEPTPRPSRRNPGQRALHGSSMALLELLAAAARTRVVAADPGVRIQCGRLVYGGPRAGSRITLDQPVGVWPRCHHRRGAARPTQRTRPRTAHPRPAHVARPATRRPDLDLELEPTLGERRVHVMHQPDEHFVAFPLV